MHLSFSKTALNIPYHAFLRQAGYTYITSRHTGQNSFVRSFGKNNYPRFHVYVIEDGEQLIFNVHLDQKQASYQGSSAHSGEYDSPLVKQELERLQALLGGGKINNNKVRSQTNEPTESKEQSRTQRWSNLIKGN